MPASLQFVAATATALQCFVAYRILKRRPIGPFALVAGAMFVLNGLAALQLALTGVVPDLSARFFNLADGATGPLILAVGLLLWRFPRHDQWDRPARWIMLAGGTWASFLVLSGLTQASYDGFLEPNWSIIHSLPGYIGLGVTGLAVSRAVGRADAARAREAGLLGFAYLGALTVNTGLSGVYYGWSLLHDQFVNGPDVRSVAVLIAIAFALASFAVLAWPRQANPTWRGYVVLAGLAGVFLSLAALRIDPTNPARYAIYLLFVSSSYFVRPICVGFVLLGRATWWAVYDTAIVGALVLVAKSVAFLLGVPWSELGQGDVAGAGVALLLAPLAWYLPRTLARNAVTKDAIPSDELLARFLLTRFHETSTHSFVTKQEIEQATGIKENNLAAAVRRLEQRLGADLPPGSFVAERIVGVRGRKQYRLTDEGARRARGAVPQA